MNYMNLFPAASRDLPRFSALAAAVLRQAEDLIAVIPSLTEAFSLSASGTGLDAFGESVGLPRKAGWTDAKYREYLRMKMLRWNWDGTNGTVSALLEAAVPGATESDNGNGTVTVSVPWSLPVTASELFPVPAGIRTINNPG